MYQWLWDALRQDYYYFSQERNAYIYQSGGIVPRVTNQNVGTTETQESSRQQPSYQRSSMSDPGAYQRSETSHEYQNYAESGAQDSSNGRLASANAYYQYQTANQTQNSTPQVGFPLQANYQVPASYQNPVQAVPIYQPITYQHATPASYASVRPQQSQQYVQTSIQKYPAEEITDPDLLRQGLQAHSMLRGTAGSSERLDSSYRVRRPGKKFFKRGKVLKMLFPEMAGEATTDITMEMRFCERIYCKIRWFVVVKEGKDSCTALPIQTYGGRGATKAGIVQWHHAIIYTHETSPFPGEDGLLGPIRVRGNTHNDRLDARSRINFGKMYTIEHNCKVYDFGNVHEDYLSLLIRNWHYVLKRDITGMEEDDKDEYDDGDDDDDE